MHSPAPAPLQRCLLVRRDVADPSVFDYFLCGAPSRVPLAELVRAAGAARATQCRLETAKQAVGLGQYEVRSWAGWYRHVTLALLADAIRAALEARARNHAKRPDRAPAEPLE